MRGTPTDKTAKHAIYDTIDINIIHLYHRLSLRPDKTADLGP